MAREVILKISLDDSWDEYDTINENLFIEDLFLIVIQSFVNFKRF